MKRNQTSHWIGAAIGLPIVLICLCSAFDLHNVGELFAWGLAAAASAALVGITAQSQTHRSERTRKIVLTAAVTTGDILQTPEGLAGSVLGLSGANHAIGDTVAVCVEGEAKVTASTGVVMVDGCEVWFDHSANAATDAPSNDRDFYLGTLVGDKATGDTEITVRLNEKPNYIVDLRESGFDHVPVLTSGTPSLAMVGGTARAAFSATAEAQKLDLLSKRSWPHTAPWVFEAEVEVSTNADADVADLNVGVANATHASDADSITEAVFAHWDMGADLNLDAESDDGTTEVAATDTTVDWAVGTPKRIVIDGRDETDIKIYADGVRVLSGTTFTLANATGPLKALFHLEKSSNDSPGVVELHRMTVRLMEQVTN